MNKTNKVYINFEFINAQRVKSKRINLNQRLRIPKNFIDNNKYTRSDTKLLIFKSLLKPIRIYGPAALGKREKIKYKQNAIIPELRTSEIIICPLSRIQPHRTYRL